AVDEQVNRVAVELLHLRPANKASQAEPTVERLLVRLQGNRQVALAVAEVHQIVQDLAPENLEHAFAQRWHRRRVQQFGVIVAQQEALGRMRQAVMRDQGSDVRNFGLFGAQKLLTGGDVEEQVAHGYGGSHRASHFIAAQDFAASDL